MLIKKNGKNVNQAINLENESALAFNEFKNVFQSGVATEANL